MKQVLQIQQPERWTELKHAPVFPTISFLDRSP